MATGSGYPFKASHKSQQLCIFWKWSWRVWTVTKPEKRIHIPLQRLLLQLWNSGNCVAWFSVSVIFGLVWFLFADNPMEPEKNAFDAFRSYNRGVSCTLHSHSRFRLSRCETIHTLVRFGRTMKIYLSLNRRVQNPEDCQSRERRPREEDMPRETSWFDCFWGTSEARSHPAYARACGCLTQEIGKWTNRARESAHSEKCPPARKSHLVVLTVKNEEWEYSG